MPIEEVVKVGPLSEPIAKAFHEAYERLAPAFGYKTREASAVEWKDVPWPNRNLMISTVQTLLDQRLIAATPEDRATPGETEADRK